MNPHDSPPQGDRVLDPERDAAALKALTHPLRIELLGLLRQHGPATASELAARTGESSASASYHLRVLAKYAFVAEAEHRDGRERRWRAVHAMTSWNNEEMRTTPHSRAFLDVIRRAQVEHLERTLAQYEKDLAAGRIEPQWVEPSGVEDSMPRLTAESLRELRQAIHDKAAELAARDEDDPRAERVTLVLAALPQVSGNSPTDTGTSGTAEGAP
ncbi:ArsR/SmtB family transcription factor [Streptomyces sp. CA-294286]|uniref:ArsR/SmtB family transcription factor n=1 Tax=Streptomyces sp. CA-294286 TaxID=3240070 RepID=UPI003D8A029B